MDTAKTVSGSALFHRLLNEVAAEFPAALADAGVPADSAAFRRNFGDVVARFEAARLASSDRLAIARALTERSAQAHADDAAGDEPAVMLETMQGEAASDLRLEVPFEGKTHAGREVFALLDRLLADHHVTAEAHRRLRWIAHHIETQGGVLDLRGHKFAILGASAELSPAPLLLRAGASVLWIDLQKPPAPSHGSVVYAEQARDLLSERAAIVQAVRSFAGDDRVHLGLFAYAPGKSRELRLAEAMNRVVHELGKERVRSVASFVSPTSPGAMQPEDVEIARARSRSPKAWQRALSVVGVLKGPASYGSAARAVISLQGASYQAAQYVSKMLQAEVFADEGFRVSVNVAGISRTRSLQHPLFQAAFEGAPAFGVRIFDAETTRTLATLLMLHDLLAPAESRSAEQMHCAQIHGGVYAVGWQFEAAVRAAAVLGAMRKPQVMWRRS